MNRPIFKTISIDIYNTDVLFTAHTTVPEIIAHLNSTLKYRLDPEEVDDLKLDTEEGKTTLLKGNQVVLWVNELRHDLIAHEAFHAVEFILDNVGVKHDIETSSEAYAYLLGFLIQAINDR